MATLGKGSPHEGDAFSDVSITYPSKNMNKKIITLIVAMVVMDILDGDFKNISLLDVVKILLYIICFILLIVNGRKDEE